MDDLDELIPYVSDHVASGPYGVYGIDPEKVEFTLIQLMTLNTGLVLLLKDGDTIAGFLLAVANETMFSRKVIAVEIGMYIAPDYRRTRGFKMLREAFDFWSNKVGSDANVLSSMDNEFADRLDKLYTKEGRSLAERSYLKWLR